MYKIFFFLIISICISAQKTEFIKLDQSIKDRKSLTKSLTLIDNRTDKEVGILIAKKGTAEVKLINEDLKTYVENWFESDNKIKGNNDIVLILEELKVYNEKAPNDLADYPKVRIKISSFLKRNDRYYFIDRFNNVFVEDNTDSKAAKNIAKDISEIISEFIKYSYSGLVLKNQIPENELENYETYLSKNNKSINNSSLTDGVYLSFKSFFDQTPSAQHTLEKNKQGEIKKIVNKQDLKIPMSEVFCYVNNGIAYRFTANGFKEIKKNDNGYYIIASRSQLFAEKVGTGAMIGGIAGGMVGAMVGAAIDSESNKGVAKGFGFKTPTITKVYIDALTGEFIFTE